MRRSYKDKKQFSDEIEDLGSDVVELTPTDIKNGWTEKSLTKYIRERQNKEFELRDSKPKIQGLKQFNPKKW